jgi:STE24 endopeptidase
MIRPCLLVLCLLCASASLARPASPQSPASDGSRNTGALAAARPEPGLVAVPQPSEKAMRYYRSGVAWWIFGTVWGLLVPAVMLLTGFSAGMRNIAARLGRKWLFIIAVYVVIYSIVGFVIDLPVNYYSDFVRQHAYGLSDQTFQKWSTDQLKGLAVGLVLGPLVLWVPYWLLERSPSRWWFWTGLLIVPFLFLILFIQPLWIEPLFNDFGPMQDKQLESRILDLADRAGIEGGRVYEVNKSVDTKQLNAYVSGFGSTKRIVLWDTTIAKLDEDELLIVMGHEIGHYVLHHLWVLIGSLSAFAMISLYLIHRTAGWVIARFRNRLGFDRLSDVASLPLISLLFGLYFFLVSPVALALNRHLEHEADRFGLEITKNNHAAATAFVKMTDTNLANPRPGFLVKIWRANHPPVGERIDFANEYRPWERNEPLKYGHLFRDQK